MAAYYRDAISPRPMRDGGMFGCRDAMRDERRGCNLCVCTDHDQMSCWRDVGGLARARYSCGEGTLLFMMVDASTRGVWLARGPAGVPCPWLAVSCGLLSGLVTNMSYVAVECDADPGARRCGPCAAAPPAPPPRFPRLGSSGFVAEDSGVRTSRAIGSVRFAADMRHAWSTARLSLFSALSQTVQRMVHGAGCPHASTPTARGAPGGSDPRHPTPPDSHTLRPT